MKVRSFIFNSLRCLTQTTTGIVTLPILFLILAFGCNVAGDKSMGHNFAVIYGDNPKDKVLVYCLDGFQTSCDRPIYILPTLEENIDSTSYKRWLINAASNERWIIAKTFDKKLNSEQFWIVNPLGIPALQNYTVKSRDSLLKSHISGPFNPKTFQEQLDSLQIKLQLY